jgi:protein-S-isoprenylcysteine O-methyltransferase Ste14
MLVRPPRLYLAAIVIGVSADMWVPLPWVPVAIERTVGIPLVLLALTLFTAALGEMRRARTGIRADQPSTAIVERGPYRFSRNPIYLAFTLLQLGLAVWLNSVWLLATLGLAVAVVSYGVIAREERYLERKFGEGYLQYKRRVRRWL